jgi:hypothetical protein
LQLFAPHVKSTVENITKELTQLPTQDLSWVPFVYSYQKEHWVIFIALRLNGFAQICYVASSMIDIVLNLLATKTWHEYQMLR